MHSAAVTRPTDRLLWGRCAAVTRPTDRLWYGWPPTTTPTHGWGHAAGASKWSPSWRSSATARRSQLTPPKSERGRYVTGVENLSSAICVQAGSNVHPLHRAISSSSRRHTHWALNSRLYSRYVQVRVRPLHDRPTDLSRRPVRPLHDRPTDIAGGVHDGGRRLGKTAGC